MSELLLPNRQLVLPPKLIPPIWKSLPGSQSLFLQSPVREVCFAGTRGPGKGLPIDEPVYTPTGPKAIGSLILGDLISCPDGTVSPVVGIFPQGLRPTYELTFADGSVARCDDQHIWSLHVGGKFKAGVYKNYTMPQVIEMFNVGCYKLNVPTLNEIKLGSNFVPAIDPYTLGLFLGDGCSAQRVSYCTVDDELAQHVVKNGFKEGAPDKRNTLRNFVADQNFKDQITELGLRECRAANKFVPIDYLNASSEVRLAVLQGLMDTDGTIDKKGYITFCSGSKQLAEDVQYLARSLGAKATLSSRYPTIDGVAQNIAYSIYIQTGNKFIPFRLKRKVDRIIPYMHKHLSNKIESIKELGMQETVCIKIAHPDGLFITRDFIVTHNTDSMLMAFAQYCGRGYGDYWRGIIFRRNYKHLDDIISKSKRWFNRSAQKPRFLAGSSSLKWVWPTGEELLLRAFEDPEDYWSYHGHEYPFIGWEELTSWPSIDSYESMKSTNRSSYQMNSNPNLPMIPRLIRSSTNPYGVGHAWVKGYFIDPAPYGKVITDKDGNKRVALFGSIKENPFLGEDYIKTLQSITDPNKRKAWLEGSWDITSGGMFDDLWDATKHILKPFKIPSSWRIDRSFDWGSSRPFSCGWWAQSDGTDAVLPDGSTRSFPRKTLFRIGEWYGSTGKPNEGLRMTAKNVAIGILAREKQLGIQNRVTMGPADSAIYNVTDDASIGQNMESEGVFWTMADKRAGSRKNGWELMRDRLSASADDENTDKPGMYVFDNCRDFIRTVPPLPRDPRDPDDVDCFVAGTMISCPHAKVAIEDLKIGDYVNTPIGPRRLLKAGVAGIKAVTQVTLSNGVKLKGTLDHKIYVENTGLRPLCKLLLGDTVTPEEELSWLSHKFTTESYIDDTLMLEMAQQQECIFHAGKMMLFSWEHPCYIELSGKPNEAKSPEVWTSTISTTTPLTTVLKTFNWCLKRIMLDTICKEDLQTVGISKRLLKLGETVTKDKQLFDKILKSAVRTLPQENLRALIVARILKQNIQDKKIVNRLSALLKRVKRVIHKNNVSFVEQASLLNPTKLKKSKLAVTSVDGNCGEEKVYYLTVDQSHLFYANGILSTNTDAEDHIADDVRYRCLAAEHTSTRIKIGGV